MKATIISVNSVVRDLAGLLEQYVVLFVERDGILAGSITNGDFRRGIANGVQLHDHVDQLMNRSPVCVTTNDTYETRLARAKELPAGLRYMAETDERRCIRKIVSDKALVSIPNMAVIMAGGLGTRLHSLTASTPKPMLRIGDRPVLQLIIEQLRRAGISRFVVSVNYKADIIKGHFGDGGEFDVSIQYIEEPERLGTAGSLSLLDKRPEQPFLVINGDVLTELDPQSLLHHHVSHRATATLCLHQHRQQIPYGVVRTHAGYVSEIKEKPVETYSVNAGIYVLDPECLALIPCRKYFEMTSLLQEIARRDMKIGAYQLSGYWIDIGSLDDFHRATMQFPQLLEDL